MRHPDASFRSALVITALVSCLVTAPALADVLHVPGDYPTIADALAAATFADEVRVAAGVYVEPELILPPLVHLVGAGLGPDGTRIHPAGAHRLITTSDGNLVADLSLQGGAAPQGGGLVIGGEEVTVRDVLISGCQANLGGGIFIDDAHAVLERVHVIGCVAQTAGGGLYAFNTEPIAIHDSVLHDNRAGAYGGAWYAARSQLTLNGCTVLDNQAGWGCEGAAFHGGPTTVASTLSVGNIPPAVGGIEFIVVTDLAGRLGHACSLRWEPGWDGYLADQLADPGAGNLAADPLLCREPGGLLEFYGVAGDSPALPQNNPGCGQIGAFGQGCTATPVTDTPAAACALHAAAPNPFNPSTTIRYEVAGRGPVHLAIYALNGRRVATLVDETRAAGRHAVTWAGRDDHGRTVASGVYLCRLRADGRTAAMRLTLVK